MCFEIFNKATDNAPELTEVYASPMFLKNWKTVLIYLLINLVNDSQSDVANMNFYNRKIVILSNK